MNRIFEVNLMRTAAKTVYVSAETAEDAGNIAETLYANGAIDLESDTGIHIEAVSAENEEYDSRVIDEANNLKSCKDCELYYVFNGICPWS